MTKRLLKCNTQNYKITTRKRKRKLCGVSLGDNFFKYTTPQSIGSENKVRLTGVHQSE